MQPQISSLHHGGGNRKCHLICNTHTEESLAERVCDPRAVAGRRSTQEQSTANHSTPAFISLFAEADRKSRQRKPQSRVMVLRGVLDGGFWGDVSLLRSAQMSALSI